jgi:hypothetical protein
VEKESPASAVLPVDNTDWLKSAAIVGVMIDHVGYFFMADDLWSSVIGRPVAPVFFFLLGYARTTTVPHRWVWLGVVLTALESWNAGWNWVVANVLLSFALVRIARPHVDRLLQRHGWLGFGLLSSALVALLGVAANIVDYGAAGWLWALFGYWQRVYVEGRSTARSAGAQRAVACFVAAAVFVWQEQEEYRFPPIAFGAVILGVGVVTLCLFLFRRGPSRVQPPEVMARVLRFTGCHTLEIYALQLGLSEIIVKLIPSYAA